jgi:hypothetical protein
MTHVVQVVDVDVADLVGGVVERVLAGGALVGPVADLHDLVVDGLGDEAVALPLHDVVVVREAGGVLAAVARLGADAPVADEDALQVDGGGGVLDVVVVDGVGEGRHVDAGVGLAREPEVVGLELGVGGEEGDDGREVVLGRRGVRVLAGALDGAVGVADAGGGLDVEGVGEVGPGEGVLEEGHGGGVLLDVVCGRG